MQKKLLIPLVWHFAYHEKPLAQCQVISTNHRMPKLPEKTDLQMLVQWQFSQGTVNKINAIIES